MVFYNLFRFYLNHLLLLKFSHNNEIYSNHKTLISVRTMDAVPTYTFLLSQI